MKKSLVWSAALLGVVLLLGVVSVSARSSSTLAKSGVGPAAFAVPLATPLQTMTLSSSAIYTWENDGDKDKDKDGDGDHDRDDRHRHRDHDPTPEPSTLLSFGAAILIGGGVLYSRRLRKSK